MQPVPTSPSPRGEILCVWVNCASEDEAARIAAAALAGHLAASATIHAPVTSSYRWQGRLETAREVPLLLKTRPGLSDDLVRLVGALHSYAVPSILALRAEATAGYAAWVDRETRPAAC